MKDNPLVFKRKEKIDKIPEPEQQIQSMPLNISLSQNPKRRGRPKKINLPTTTPTDTTVDKAVTRSRGLMTTKKISGKTS
jgi:hypothetical protein